jgi:hypothetical protein
MRGSGTRKSTSSTMAVSLKTLSGSSEGLTQISRHIWKDAQREGWSMFDSVIGKSRTNPRF